MKKLLSIMVLLLIFIPISAKADIGAPELKPYEIIVLNPEGTDMYDYDGKYTTIGKVAYNTKCKIFYEDLKKGELYLEANCEGYKEEFFIKSSSDIKLISNNHEYKGSNNDIYNFYATGDIKLYIDEYLQSGYNGQVIPKGTDFVAHEATSELWYYYESGSTKGYFYIYQRGDEENLNILRKYDNKIMINDIQYVYKNAYGNEEVNITITNFIELHSEYLAPYYTGSLFDRYKVNYNGVECWIEKSDLSTHEPQELLVKDISGIEIYDKEFKNKMPNIQLESNKKYNVEYIYNKTVYNNDDDENWYSYAYTDVNGTYYWVKTYDSSTDSSYAILEKKAISDESTEKIKRTTNKTTRKITEENDDKTIEPVQEVEENQTIGKFYNLRTNIVVGILAAVLLSICGVITLVIIKRKKEKQTLNEVTYVEQTTNQTVPEFTSSLEQNVIQNNNINDTNQTPTNNQQILNQDAANINNNIQTEQLSSQNIVENTENSKKISG